MQDHFSGGEKPTQIDRPQEFHADFSFWIDLQHALYRWVFELQA